MAIIINFNDVSYKYSATNTKCGKSILTSINILLWMIIKGIIYLTPLVRFGSIIKHQTASISKDIESFQGRSQQEMGFCSAFAVKGS